MHPAVRFHLFATVVCVQVAALLVDRRVPYWPIEVSRTAASGPAAFTVFVVGAATLGVTLYQTATLCATTAALWLALLVIALFDDVSFFEAHMGGVAALAAVAVAAAVQAGRGAVVPLGAGAALYLFRVVIKVAAVLAYERLPTLDWRRPASLALVARHAQLIMLHGARVCRSPAETMPAFYLGGVLQWVVFYAWSFIL